MNKSLQNTEDVVNDEPAESTDLLKPFTLYGWRPDPNLSDDENCMDLTLLVTRSSNCLQGSMACILVRPSSSSVASVAELERRLYGGILGVATNQPLFSQHDSDIHAEIGALGLASRRGNVTEGCTAYITMPPCKRCFAALVVSGVKRIVFRRPAPAVLLPVAEQRGIVLVNLEETREQTARISALTQSDSQPREEILQQRKRRKLLRGEKKGGKKKQNEQPKAK